MLQVVWPASMVLIMKVRKHFQDKQVSSCMMSD